MPDTPVRHSFCRWERRRGRRIKHPRGRCCTATRPRRKRARPLALPPSVPVQAADGSPGGVTTVSGSSWLLWIGECDLQVSGDGATVVKPGSDVGRWRQTTGFQAGGGVDEGCGSRCRARQRQTAAADDGRCSGRRLHSAERVLWVSKRQKTEFGGSKSSGDDDKRGGGKKKETRGSWKTTCRRNGRATVFRPLLPYSLPSLLPREK